jgi:sulfotransferase
MEKIYFLSGMQRSGSTLLSCLLNQHPEIHATATSPLLDVLNSAQTTLEECSDQFTFDYESITERLTKSIINSFHEEVKKPVVIDKHRGWIGVISQLEKSQIKPKILCTNRSVPEIITSFIQLIQNNNTLNNLIDKTLRSRGIPISINNRADYLFNDFVNGPRNIITQSLKECGEYICMVEYNDLVSNPQETMNKIYEFLEIEEYNHNFDHIENTCKEEKDDAWGMENLHIIRNKLQKTSTPPEEVLGKELTEYYRQFDIKYS